MPLGLPVPAEPAEEDVEPVEPGLVIPLVPVPVIPVVPVPVVPLIPEAPVLPVPFAPADPLEMLVTRCFPVLSVIDITVTASPGFGVPSTRALSSSLSECAFPSAPVMTSFLPALYDWTVPVIVCICPGCADMLWGEVPDCPVGAGL